MNELCAEIGWKSINHYGEQLCGDHVEVIEKPNGTPFLTKGTPPALLTKEPPNRLKIFGIRLLQSLRDNFVRQTVFDGFFGV